jgi:chitinase
MLLKRNWMLALFVLAVVPPVYGSLPSSFLGGYICPTCTSDPAPQNLLANIHPAYNVVFLAFLSFDSSGNVLNGLDAPKKSFSLTKSDVQNLQNQGRKVLASVGGGAGAVLDCGSSSTFVSNFGQGLVSIVDEFGFDGIDFDIEHRSGDMIQCANIMTSVISIFKSEVPDAIVTITPQMTNLYPDYPQIVSGFNELSPLIASSYDHLDIIQPQMYNTWGQVETISYAEKYVSELSGGFSITTPSKSVLNITVPLDKLVLGYPASPNGAGSGYLDPASVVSMAVTLKLRGLMTWSIGWDQQSGWKFANAFQLLTSNNGSYVH